MQPDYQNRERRRHPRFEVKDLAIAVPNKVLPQVGRIINISKGGMAVRYLDQENWTNGAYTVDILINSNFLMTHIPIQNVGDFKVENQVSFSVMTERQCCLKFGTLSAEQEKLLDEFILKYAVGNS